MKKRNKPESTAIGNEPKRRDKKADNSPDSQ